jgi:hypothetical protein
VYQWGKMKYSDKQLLASPHCQGLGKSWAHRR